MAQKSEPPFLSVVDAGIHLADMPKQQAALVVEVYRDRDPSKSPEVRFISAENIVDCGAYVAIRVRI